MNLITQLGIYRCETDRIAYHQGEYANQYAILPIPHIYAAEAAQMAALPEDDAHKIQIVMLKDANTATQLKALKWLKADTHGNGLSAEGVPMNLKCEWIDRIGIALAE